MNNLSRRLVLEAVRKVHPSVHMVQYMEHYVDATASVCVASVPLPYLVFRTFAVV